MGKLTKEQMRLCQHPIKFNKGELKYFYSEECLSCQKIAENFGCSEETIRRNLILFNIPRRKKTWRFSGWNKGKKMPVKQRKQISKTRKMLYQTGKLKHWHKGKNWELKVKQKISNSLKGKMMGEKNYNWKGGDKNKYRVWRRRINDSLEYREFRKSIFARDNYQCALCDKKSNGDLEAHHILTVNFHQELLYEKENCITLCKICHNKIKNKEKIYEGEFRKILQN